MIYAVFALLVVVAAVVNVIRLRMKDAQRDAEMQQYVEGFNDLLEASREFALAARESVSKVRTSIDEAIRRRFPEIDAIAIFAQEMGKLVCVYSTPDGRLARYAGRAEYDVSDESALPVAALRAGKTAVSAQGGKPIHPVCRSAAAIPLTLDLGNTTVVYVESTTRSLGQILAPLEILLEQAEPALVLADARDDSESRATYDSLTGLLQRASFELRLRDEIDRCEDSGASLALLYVDADNFKAWNDTFGHHSGDMLLQRIAEILNDNRVTAHDLVGRRGGDEFVMVLLDVDRAQALSAALSVGAAIAFDDRRALVPPEKMDVEMIPVTASIGVAVFPHDGETSSDLILRADKIMYEAKARGRDRVCYVGDDGELHDTRSSERDRRDPDTRPFADRRRSERFFAEAANQ